MYFLQCTLAPVDSFCDVSWMAVKFIYDNIIFIVRQYMLYYKQRKYVSKTSWVKLDTYMNWNKYKYILYKHATTIKKYLGQNVCNEEDVIYHKQTG